MLINAVLKACVTTRRSQKWKGLRGAGLKAGKLLCHKLLQGGSSTGIAANFERPAALYRACEVVDKSHAGGAIRQVLLDPLARHIVHAFVDEVGESREQSLALDRFVIPTPF